MWGGRSTRAVCLRNPATQEFAATLVRDVAGRVNAVKFEAAHWLAPHAVHAKLDAPQRHVFRRLSACCVCEHRMQECSRAGIDSDRLSDQLRAGDASLTGDPRHAVPTHAVDDYLAMRVDGYPAYQRSRPRIEKFAG